MKLRVFSEIQVTIIYNRAIHVTFDVRAPYKEGYFKTWTRILANNANPDNMPQNRFAKIIGSYRGTQN